VLFYFKGGFIKGLVSKIESKDYYVLPSGEDKLIRCSLRGKFKKDFSLKKDKLYHTDIVIVGDYVEFELNEDGSGVITKVEERKNYISRKAPRIRGAGFRGERLEQIIAANIDKFFIVSSITQPEFNNKVIDRFVVAGESSGLNIIIIINKIDLDDEKNFKSWEKLYKNIGYKVIPTSTISLAGIDELKNEVKGYKNLFWGHSGVANLLYSIVCFPV